MAGKPAAPFGALLRQLRLTAGLTQEELAAAAQVSARSVSDLERGVNLTARRETARLLAEALCLEGSARATFEVAARGNAGPGAVAGEMRPGAGLAAPNALPRDTTGFTGRQVELAQVVEGTLTGDVAGIYAIGGMAGIGKTAFAVRAAHRLASSFPDGQIYLSLHAHTPGQNPVDPSDALASLLLTIGAEAAGIPPGLQARTALWRDQLAGRRLLLVLDDASGHEQVRPLLPGIGRSLVLVTSRRRLTALEGTRTIDLDVLSAEEAAELLVRLADRPVLDSADLAVAQLTQLCGRLPLAIGMLARQLHHHATWTVRQLTADMAAARDRLGFMRAENLSVAAAFDLSYADLSPDERRFFRRLGLHPGTDLDAYAAASLDDLSPGRARYLLESLYDHYLLTEPVQGRYRMHDLIREHARTLAITDPIDVIAAAGERLSAYYVRSADAAGRIIPWHHPEDVPADTREATIADLSVRQQALEWLEAERINLHAVAEDAVARGRYKVAAFMAAAMHGYLRSHGHWDQAAALHQLAIRAASDAGDMAAEAGAVTNLADLQNLTGDYDAAVANLNRALELYRAAGGKAGEADALNELGIVQQRIGDYSAAQASHELALDLRRALGNRAGEAAALNELGAVALARAHYAAACRYHGQALELFRELNMPVGLASALNRLGLVQRTMGDYQGAADSHREAMRLHASLGNRLGEATALNGLGMAQRAAGNSLAAITSHEHALNLYHQMGFGLGEAHAINALGAAHLSAGNLQIAADKHQEALRWYQGLRYRLGQAHALNALGTVHEAMGDKQAASASRTEARTIYRELGSLLAEEASLNPWP